MKLFQHSEGFVFCVGFDMNERKPNDRMICWSDPKTGEWDEKPDNQAGSALLRTPIKPEFIFENARMGVVIYEPGRCTELSYIGAPLVFSISHKLAEAA